MASLKYYKKPKSENRNLKEIRNKKFEMKKWDIRVSIFVFRN